MIEPGRCTACEVHKLSKMNCLRGNGPAPADLMFVGDSLTEDDEQNGKPLSGRVGDVLFRLLVMSGINVDKCFVTNLVKCRPTDESNFRRDRKNKIHYGNHKTTPWWGTMCGTRYLEDEIRAVKPKVLVAMGGPAADYIFGKWAKASNGSLALNAKTQKPRQAFRMPTMEGVMYDEFWDAKRGCYVVVIEHPARVMQNPELFSLTSEILKKVVKLRDSGPGTLTTQSFLAYSYDDAVSVINRACEHALLAYDLETDGLDWRFGELLNIGLSWKVGTGASIRWVGNDGRFLFTPDQRAELITRMKPIFQNPDRTLVGYNEPYDASWTERRLGLRVTSQRHDVQMLYHTLHTTATHLKQSLEKLAWLDTDMGDWKAETKPWFSKKKFVECPMDVMGRRNCGDVDATLRLFHTYHPQVMASPTGHHYDRLLKHLPWASTIIHMNGTNIGLETLFHMKERLTKASDALMDQFCKDVDVPKFNLNSPKKLKDVLFGKLKLPIVKKTPTGEPSTDADVLKELFKHCSKLKALMEYKKLQKLLGTYVLGLRGCALFGNSKKRKPDVWSVEEACETQKEGYTTDGRVHPSVSVVGTVTGRPSISRPNTANQPRPTEQQRKLGVILRQAFVAGKGKWVVEVDQSQAELRTLAAVSGDEALKAAVYSKEGVHRRTAASLLNIPVEEITDEQKAPAKTVVFAITYGGTEHTIEKKIPSWLDAELKRKMRSALEFQSIPEENIVKQLGEYFPSKKERLELAKSYIGLWRAQYPVAGAWIDAAKEKAIATGQVITVFGRVFHFPLIVSEDFFVRSACLRAAVNYSIQSPASDLTFMAGIRVQHEIYKRGYKSVWTNMVYDSLAYEVPDDELEAMKKLVTEEMERPVPELPVDFKSDMEVGRCWKESKKEDEEELDVLEDENAEEEGE